MGATPLLTERLGCVGLEGPSGGWLGLIGGSAYMPATLDKTLAEFGLLEVDDALRDGHAAHWSALTRHWSVPGPAWLQAVAYGCLALGAARAPLAATTRRDRKREPPKAR